jgi:2-acylglycerol O-acyltransferase 2
MGVIPRALRASLVPVLSFGENDLFDQLMPNPEGTALRTWQNRLKKALGFSLPMFAGRGIFNYDYGFLPRRKRVVTVGAPSHAQIHTERDIHTRVLLSQAALPTGLSFAPLTCGAAAVGTPIPCQRTETPSAEAIDRLHARYLAALEQLFDRYKDMYAQDRRHDLRFVQ